MATTTVASVVWSRIKMQPARKLFQLKFWIYVVVKKYILIGLLVQKQMTYDRFLVIVYNGKCTEHMLLPKKQGVWNPLCKSNYHFPSHILKSIFNSKKYVDRDLPDKIVCMFIKTT